ncbi:FGGY-family carbohydrate kinase [Amphibacillus cookii]|uniref:FGGY-family carbohydrate kinase n=1 Tax=Amphibacillus cookii TaxID=767787 RepID=UPI00195E20A4|nr:FGGY-family carbohydrate kinase [Amphibacillus cookii]MBM7541632.1 xylulokinase/glycerol kinase [Amphibacillus cookii]
MDVYLVIDIGTSSTRGILYNDDSKVLLKEQIKNKPNFINNTVMQDVFTWDQVVDKILRKVSLFVNQKNFILKGIFVTSQRSSLICLDKNGIALMPAIMWQDTNANYVVEKFDTKNELIRAKTGSYLNPIYLASKIYMVQDKYPEIAKKTRKYLSIADYIRYKLTGEFITDCTYASRTQLFNIYTLEWDEDLLELFSIDNTKLCKVDYPGEKGSYVKKDYLSKFEIYNDVMYVSSGGDQQCSAIGMGAVSEGDIAISLGTGGYILAPSDNLNTTSSVNINCHSSKDFFMLESILPTVALAIDWVKTELFSSMNEKDFYNFISTSIKDKKTPIINFPHFQGRGTPDWNLKAKSIFFGISYSTKKEDLLLAVLEGIAIELRNNIEIIQCFISEEIEQVRVSGGLSNNDGINQLISDMLGKKVEKCSDSESTAFGAFIIGYCAINNVEINHFYYKHYRTLNNKIYYPSLKNKSYYDEKFYEWNKLYDKLY